MEKSFFWNEGVVPPHDKDVFLLKSGTFYRADKILGIVYMNGNKDVMTFCLSVGIFSSYNELEQLHSTFIFSTCCILSGKTPIEMRIANVR